MAHTYKVDDILKITSNPVIWQKETAHQYELGQEVIVLAVGENCIIVKRHKVKCADRWNLRQTIPVCCVDYADNNNDYTTLNERDTANIGKPHVASFNGIIIQTIQ